MSTYSSGDAILNRFTAMCDVSVDRPICSVAWFALAARAQFAATQATNPVVVQQLVNVSIEAERCAMDSITMGI